MSAKDTYHDVVRDALEKEDWIVTDDPLQIRFLDVELRIDLGAERVIAAERDNEKIAVEIRAFLVHQRFLTSIPHLDSILIIVKA